MTIINRTPHSISIPSTLGAYTLPAPIDPSEIARVETTTAALPPVDGMPMMRTTWHCIVGLPSYVDGTYHIVSTLVVEMAAALGRTISDLLVPGAQVRDAQGRIVGCAGFTTAESCSPLLRAPSGCAERVAEITTPHATPAILSRRESDHEAIEGAAIVAVLDWLLAGPLSAERVDCDYLSTGDDRSRVMRAAMETHRSRLVGH